LLTTETFAQQTALTDPRLRPLLNAFTTDDSYVPHAAQLRAAWNHHTWNDLQRITAPTLVQHGLRDRMISVRAGRAIADRVRGARLDVYPDTGHLIAIERPESINALRTFLRRCEDESMAGAAPGTFRRWQRRR
jgi:pimeloyl-ACP methyl ester carboxylesterase